MKRLTQVLLLLTIVTVYPSIATPGDRSEEESEEREFARIVAPSIDPESSCKLCHADVLHLREDLIEDDAHEGTECVECHLGRRFNPHLPPELDEQAIALFEEHGAYFEHSPAIIAGCFDCHEDETDAWRESVHGAGAETDDGLSRASCVDCHGSLHALTTPVAAKRWMAERCIVCHDFDPDEKGPASPHVVDTYRETVHGKMLALGNNEAAGCADCHTGHEIYAADDPRSTVHPDNRATTCRECHEEATDSFTAAISHRPHTIDADFWAWATALLFSVLTVGTVVMLLVHVALDLFHAGRNLIRPSAEPPPESGAAVLVADDEVERFDGHIRAQHAMMIVSFVTLVLTGWPLKSAAVGVSSGFVQALGGQATLALIHRLAGLMLIGVSIYHLSYLAVRWRRGQLTTSMIPAMKDLSDLGGNVLYYLGVRKERPKFGVFTYYEKFDYWAIFWGVPVMVVTGLILWFPELTARILPGDFILLALIAHSDEALLALLAIFLWHFYNQHLRPSVFPMSWVWLTGRITAEALHDEHRLEYEERYGSTPPSAPANSPAWNDHPGWSFAALAVVLVAAGLVVILDITSVRAQIAALESHSVPAGLIASRTEVPGVLGAFDEGFDPWSTCFDCHNEKHYASDDEHFPHQLHFEDEELEDDCAGCHESRFHEKIITVREGCLDCHDADEIGLPEAGST